MADFEIASLRGTSMGFKMSLGLYWIVLSECSGVNICLYAVVMIFMLADFYYSGRKCYLQPCKYVQNIEFKVSKYY